jgi:hypothetical protein
MANAPTKFVISVGDTRTPLARTLYQGQSVVDLSGLTVKFYMVDSTGLSVVAESTTGVTVVSASLGKVSKTFLAADVDTAGIYYGWFTVYNGSAFDHFPAEGRNLIIEIVTPG